MTEKIKGSPFAKGQLFQGGEKRSDLLSEKEKVRPMSATLRNVATHYVKPSLFLNATQYCGGYSKGLTFFMY